MKSRSLLMAALACLGGLTTAQAFARNPKVPMDSEAWLRKWSRLPDLLTLARERAQGGDAYALLPKLEAEYRQAGKPFQKTTVFRSQEQCKSGEHTFTRTTLDLVDAKGATVKTTGLIRHEIEQHKAPFPADLAAFLGNLPIPAPSLAILDFPGDLTVESEVKAAYDDAPEGDARWAVPTGLELKPPANAEAVPGGFRVVVGLANTTDRPMPVALWQVGGRNPIHAQLAPTADVKRKPAPTGGPITPPPVPLPPFRVTLPPMTEVRFATQVDLADYAFKPGANASLEWTFHFWKAPEVKRTLPVALPRH